MVTSRTGCSLPIASRKLAVSWAPRWIDPARVFNRVSIASSLGPSSRLANVVRIVSCTRSSPGLSSNSARNRVSISARSRRVEVTESSWRRALSSSHVSNRVSSWASWLSS